MKLLLTETYQVMNLVPHFYALGDEIDGTECCGTQLRVWDKNAGSYDKEVGLDETLMGLSLMRRWLLRNAKGSVLEVSAGIV
ncbi:hypothetical protein SARC_15093 [Sphaeroforma arctica JP610]|uniref:Uncharacterized protein n=1 Tax=Sphaeroforma arctica JP610 TaxID=667725 RepID=A0A0L0F6I8_9EUKA|nr:hypothetical protein SARC_15093 [Sphaeroforma arctica JP610]KNC72352.1 hypothetical protein SARC_15093 [Sphaeroforma arctica JP610]|eukprot:XP_014146254.1 hypothetical protein SARC_15093 [Sphaeroforma arctica JP610]